MDTQGHGENHIASAPMVVEQENHPGSEIEGKPSEDSTTAPKYRHRHRHRRRKEDEEWRYATEGQGDGDGEEGHRDEDRRGVQKETCKNTQLVKCTKLRNSTKGVRTVVKQTSYLFL